MQRWFEAAVVDRFTVDWGTSPRTIDSVIRQHQSALVSRSREQVANNEYARRYVQMVSQNVVGSRGIELQSTAVDDDGTLDEAANRAVEKAWSEWSKPENCDASGRLSWREMQSAAVSDAARDGEFFILIKRTKSGLRLQRLDPIRIPVEETRELDKGYIKCGILFGDDNRPDAYLVRTYNPAHAAFTFAGKDYIRVPAEDVIHGFRQEYPQQVRGVPWLSTALRGMKHLHEYEEAALINARQGASKAGFFTRNAEDMPWGDEDHAPLELEVSPGLFHELPPGYEFQGWNPQYPQTEFSDFHKQIMRGVASGLGVSYSLLANDLEGVNFSSLRQGAIDERDHWRVLQSWLTESLLEPVFDAWVESAMIRSQIVLTSGKPLPYRKIDKIKSHSWQPRRWQWVDPKNEVDAAIKQKNALLASTSQLIRDQGRDPVDVYREVATDIAKMREAGIPEEMIQSAVFGSAGAIYDTTSSESEPEQVEAEDG